jgi:Skp family chaperone for outer membrane proteins
MTTRVSTIFVALVLSSFLLLPTAQGQKIGYANQEALLANMPEMREVQRQLQQEARQQQQLQQKMQQYQQQQSLLSDSARAQRERELRQLQQQLQKSSQQRQQELRKREQELMQPLLEDLQNAIESVSSEQDLDVVLRSQALLDVDENSSSVVNISPDVAQQLGIQLQQAPGEPSPTVQPSGTPTTQGGGQ